MAGSSKRRAHAERVLDTLLRQNKPMSAYQILENLRGDGIAAATTVYRALNQLLAAGRVHRIESLNAWTACCEPTHASTPVFEICESCGTVIEHVDKQLADDIAALVKPSGFTPERSVIEIRGRCGECPAKTPQQ